jgi:carbonic anhydrase
MAGNRRFVEGRPIHKDFASRRRELVSGQHPPVIVISCSDSRVPPEIIFDQGLGDLFVIRTAGNVADPIALGSIEYAAEHLHSPVLVVLGHESCGAVTAAAEGGELPSHNLEAIVEAISPALTSLRTGSSGSELVHLGVRANVRRSAEEIVRNSPVLAPEVASGKLTVIRAVYNLATGQVIRLP